MATKTYTLAFAELGPDLDNFTLSGNAGPVSPTTATRSQLLAGLDITVDVTATLLTVASTGKCTNNIKITLPGSAPVPQPEPEVEYGASLEPAFGGTLDDHIGFYVSLTQPTPVNKPFSFTVEIYVNGQHMRTEWLSGYVRQGERYYNSFTYGENVYVPEVNANGGNDVVSLQSKSPITWE